MSTRRGAHGPATSFALMTIVMAMGAATMISRNETKTKMMNANVEVCEEARETTVIDASSG